MALAAQGKAMVFFVCGVRIGEVPDAGGHLRIGRHQAGLAAARRRLLRAFRLLFLRPACRQAGKACRQGDERGHDEKFPLQPLAGTLGAAGGSCSAWFVMVVLHGFTPSSSLRSVLFRVFGGHLLPQAFGFRSTAVRTVCRARHVPVFNKSIELRFRAWKAINKLDDFGPRPLRGPDGARAAKSRI